jgi:phosphate transport system substrate-binding protein
VNAVVPVYNLPQVPQLRFTGSTLAGIFLGTITKWNDPAIAKDNPGVDLPRMDIKVKHDFPSASRSGTLDTYVMADYLSKVSAAFKTALTSPSGNWPVASPIYKGAEGTAGFVRHTPGAIGYVWQNRVHGTEQYGIVQNLDGEFIAASPESLTAASTSAISSIKTESPDFRVSITNAPGKASYPIASFTWLLLYENPKEEKQNETMVSFLKWVLTDGQKVALKLGYPALPNDLVQMELKQLGASAR